MITFKEFLNESWRQKRVGSILISTFTETTRDNFIEKYASAIEKFVTDTDIPKVFQDQAIHVRIYKSGDLRGSDDLLVSMAFGIPDGMDAREFMTWSKLVEIAGKHAMGGHPRKVEFRNKQRAYYHSREEFSEALLRRRNKPDQTDSDYMSLDFTVQL